MKAKTAKKVILPDFRTVITYRESQIKEILGIEHIYHNYIREGESTLAYGIPKKGKNLSPEQMEEGILDYLTKNKIIDDNQAVFGRLISTHHFSNEDDDGNRHSVYDLEYNGTIFTTSKK